MAAALAACGLIGCVAVAPLREEQEPPPEQETTAGTDSQPPDGAATRAEEGAEQLH